MASDTSSPADKLTPEAAAEKAANREELRDPILGKVIDGCKVIRKLGQGGMGVVYLAEHEALGQDFVLKILNPSLTGSEETVERFFREAQACAQLNHPGIVAIQNVGQEGDYYYIRMEYVKGVTLEEVVKQAGQVEWKEATRYIVDVAEALSHAHRKGMIHRDIKPENIMLTPKGEIKVMDFGLAKHVHSSVKVSVTGQIVGTPFFMSPEQAGGKPTDARSDIYSLGVTLYYMTTGVKPFNGKNLQEIFLKHFFYAPESPKIYCEDLPEALCEVVKRCLKKKKKERYQSAKALTEDLRAVLADPDAALGDPNVSGPPPIPTPGPADGDGGATVQVQAESEGGATVQVGQQADDEGGATVQVGGGGDDDSDKTVAVGGKPRGEVKSVSFTSASMVFKEDDDATIQVSSVDDDQDAHEGLDLPTSVVQMMRDDGTVMVIAEEEEEEEVDTGPTWKAKKKKLIAMGLFFLIPSLFVIVMQISARGKFNDLSQTYNTLHKDTQSAKAATPELAQRWVVMCSDFQEFADGYVLAPNLTPKARQMAEKSLAEAARIAKAVRARADAKAQMIAAAKAEAERKKELKALLARATEIVDELRNRRRAKKAKASHWKEYTERALGFLEEYGEKRGRFPELGDLLATIQIPVTVMTDPGGAEIFVGENRDPEKQRTPPKGTGLIWVAPGQEFTIRAVKRGFQDWNSTTYTADRYHMLDAPLSRKLLRPAFSFGELEVKFGPSRVQQAIVPSHDPYLFAGVDGLVYFVGRSGLLRGFQLERNGQLEWPTCPGGLNCVGIGPNGKPVKEVHQIGLYGDPTAGIDVVEDVILVSSMLGTVSAHDRSKGATIWSTHLGSPVTSPPRYLPNNIVVAGTADGEVVFLSQAGRVHWSFSTHNAVVSTPYLTGNLCIVGSTDNRLYVLDWRAKKRLGSIDLGADIIVGPVPLGRRLIVGTSKGKLYLIDISRPTRPTKVATYGPGKGAVGGVVVLELDEGRAIYFSVGRSLYAVSERGKPLWVSRGKARPFFSPGGQLTAPVLHPDGDLIYVGGGRSGVLYAVDRVTGRERWRFTTPRGSDGRRSPINLMPFVLGEELFVFSGEKVYVLRPD